MSKDKFYYNEEGQLHSINGPAIERVNGDKEWWVNGLNDDHPTEKEWHDISFCLNYHDLSTEYIDDDIYI